MNIGADTVRSTTLKGKPPKPKGNTDKHLFKYPQNEQMTRRAGNSFSKGWQLCYPKHQ